MKKIDWEEILAPWREAMNERPLLQVYLEEQETKQAQGNKPQTCLIRELDGRTNPLKVILREDHLEPMVDSTF